MISICTYAEVLEDVFSEAPGNLEREITGDKYPLGLIIREGQLYDSAVLRMSDIKKCTLLKRYRVSAIIYVSRRIINQFLINLPCSAVLSVFVIIINKLSAD